jgi:hypothetical protein
MRSAAGVAGLGGGEVLTQLGENGGSMPGRHEVEPDSQRAVTGFGVATTCQRLANQSWGQ